MTNPERYALIVAGGKGSRMGSDIPKQFLLLKGLPVLMHTINVFAQLNTNIILVLPAAQVPHWEELCKTYSYKVMHQVVTGGDTRFHSVRNGLEKVPAGALVAIHDGVRPLVNTQVVEQSFLSAMEKGNAVAAVRLKDSIRELKLTGGTRNANRNNYFLVQTPQTFQSDIIKAAYEAANHYNFTDDAGVAEEAGSTIHLIEGTYGNIKITTPEDLLIAEALLEKDGH